MYLSFSTLFLSIILSILLVVLLNFLPLNFHQSLEDLQFPDASFEKYGEMSMILILVIAMTFIGMTVLFFTIFINAVVAAGICLIFSIKNRKSTLKAIRIINYVLDGGFAFVILASVTKIILFFLGY